MRDSAPSPPVRVDELDRAWAVIDGGGLVLLKLDIGYGFIGRSDAALRRMYELKGRVETNPCVIPGTLDILRALCPGVHPAIVEWIGEQAGWTTLAVVGTLDEQSAAWRSLPPYARQQCSKQGSVAVFLNPGPFLGALVDRAWSANRLLTGSSGNRSGCGNCFRPSELAASLTEGVDLFIDHGVARYENPERLATTMIDLRSLRVVRQGVNYRPLDERLAQFREQMRRHRWAPMSAHA